MELEARIKRMINERAEECSQSRADLALDLVRNPDGWSDRNLIRIRNDRLEAEIRLLQSVLE